MPFYHAGRIKYYQFNNLQNLGVYHAVFTRQGGISPEPWNSLNFGASVGDDIQRVLRNRKSALNALDVDEDNVYDLYQVHSTNVVVTNRPRLPTEDYVKGDAILTNQPKVTLMMRFADCVPILIFDSKNKVIGLIHAGWIGTVNKIVQKSVAQMISTFGTHPDDIIAGIGPSIGPDHYVVGKDVVDKIELSFNSDSDKFITYHDDIPHFDLWKTNEFMLIAMGIKNIEVARICTQCNLTDWFSHRGDHGKTGRFGVIFGLHG